MSNINALAELARFVGRSVAGSDQVSHAPIAANGPLPHRAPRRPAKTAGDLLSAVLALSARTRRIVQPRVTIDLDVFTPTGQRAVLVAFARQA